MSCVVGLGRVELPGQVRIVAAQTPTIHRTRSEDAALQQSPTLTLVVAGRRADLFLVRGDLEIELQR